MQVRARLANIVRIQSAMRVKISPARTRTIIGMVV